MGQVLLDRHIPHTSRREFGWCLVTQGTVRAFGIVLLLPERAQRPGLRFALELLAVQELVTDLAMKRLRIAVLPGAARRHGPAPGASVLKPRPHDLGNKLRSVVAPHPARRAH